MAAFTVLVFSQAPEIVRFGPTLAEWPARTTVVVVLLAAVVIGAAFGTAIGRRSFSGWLDA